MVVSSVWFGMGDCHWIAERESIGFIGTINHGTAEFRIISDTLVQLLDPDREILGPNTSHSGRPGAAPAPDVC